MASWGVISPLKPKEPSCSGKRNKKVLCGLQAALSWNGKGRALTCAGDALCKNDESPMLSANAFDKRECVTWYEDDRLVIWSHFQADLFWKEQQCRDVSVALVSISLVFKELARQDSESETKWHHIFHRAVSFLCVSLQVVLKWSVVLRFELVSSCLTGISVH